MAEVYLARPVARPAGRRQGPLPALATDEGFRVERFRQEAQAAANLQHPNIVSVFDWGEGNGTYFIVMEYVEGHTLAEIQVHEGRLHPDRAAEITADTAAALGFAHRNRVHRDVGRATFITRDGGVKVADFGIARALSDSTDQNLTKTGSVMGTATYFSPEQACGAPVDPRSDIYSLGCVLYEMTTGHLVARRRQQSPSPTSTCRRTRCRRLSAGRYDPALPETLEAITLKCLAKNPANRYPGAQDLRADLRRFLDGGRIMAEPVLAPRIDPGRHQHDGQHPVRRPDRAGGGPVGYDTAGRYDGYDDYDEYDQDEEPKRSKWFLVALVLLLLVLAGLLFLLARSFSNEDPPVDQVTVPGVVGQEVTAATQALEAEGFTVATEFVNDPAPPNQVIAQDPEAAAEADEGSTVTLTVSQGPEPVTVPDVVGRTQTEANQILTQAGFVVNVVPEENGDVPEDEVISQDPAANTQAVFQRHDHHPGSRPARARSPSPTWRARPRQPPAPT